MATYEEWGSIRAWREGWITYLQAGRPISGGDGSSLGTAYTCGCGMLWRLSRSSVKSLLLTSPTGVVH